MPTRARSWHDFFNALVWAAFPRAKKSLHERQYAAISARVPAPTLRLPAVRTPELDLLAMLDEGGVVVLAAERAAPSVSVALRAGDGDAVQSAVARGEADLLVFGHGLFDALRAVTQPLWAHPELVVCPELPPDRAARLASADEALSRALADRRVPALEPAPALRVA